MPRYIKQQDTFRCGPLAVANAAKWGGHSFSWRESKHYFTELCKCEYPNGCNPGNVGRALQRVGKSTGMGVQLIRRPTLQMLDRFLDLDCGIVVDWLFYCKECADITGHYFFIHRRTPCFYYGVNIFAEGTISKVSRKRMSKMLREQRKKTCTWVVWKSYGLERDSR